MYFMGSLVRPLRLHPIKAITASTYVRHKQNWGRGFIVLLPQVAVRPGSNAGSDGVKPASSFIIQNSMWCPTHGARYYVERNLRFVQRRRTRNSVKEQDLICAWTNAITQHQSASLSLTQAVRAKLIPTDLALVLGMKTQSLKIFSQ